MNDFIETLLYITDIYFIEILLAIICIILIYIIYKIIKSLITKSKIQSTFDNIELPIWNRVPNKDGELIYKFIGFSALDGKSKYLAIEKKDIFSKQELICYQIILHYIKNNKHITFLTKIPLKQLIYITNEDKLFRGWRQRMEPIIIDYIITDNHLNPIAAIQFKRNDDNNKFIEDVFFNIRIPVFWLSKNEDIFTKQIEEIFKRLNEYFIKANLISN